MATFTPQQIQYFQEHASDNKQPNLIATVILCLMFPCVAVFLRFLSRWRARASLKADDWLILAALLPLAGMTTTTALAVRYGEGKHVIFITNPEGFAKAYVAGVTVYSLTVACTKLSILYLYHRIFPSKGLAILASLIAVLVVTYSVALIIFDFLQCIPLSKLWSDVPGHCVSTTQAYITLAVMNVITDIMILTLPVKYVLRLHMTTARKFQVVGAFALGGIVCIFGIIRSCYVGQASIIDQTWTATEGAIWSQVEISVGIISACLPLYRQLFVPRAQPSYNEYSNKSSQATRNVPLSDRSKGGGTLSSMTATKSQNGDMETGSFAKLSDVESTHSAALLKNASRHG